ncbi:MAG: flagellar hook-associated protein FlgK [Pseudomonadota bacterium]|nr:flagellar hook-associated protein FlgK [Pseudomonadota bacterium]
MASGLIGIGISGLYAAQAGIRTTEHNISNVNTTGYRRQETVFSTQTPSFTGAGWFGNGVSIESVRSQYSQFLDNEVLLDQAQLSRHETYAAQAGQVDTLLSDSNSSLSGPLNSFFNAVNEVANDPASAAARQTLLASGRNLSGRVNTLYNSLQQKVEDSNKAIAGLSTQINTYANQLATLNQSISRQEALNGQPANDLRDQRDQAIADLNKLVNVTTVQQSGGELNVFVGNGHVLVSGTRANQFTTPQTDPSDSYNTNPAAKFPVLNVSGGSLTLDSGQITGGELGGWLAARDEVVKPALADLNRIAVAIGAEVNQVHNGGAYYDSTAAAMAVGGDFFSGAVTQTGAAIANDSWIAIDFTSNRLANENYTVGYTGPNYTVTRVSDGASAVFAAGAEVTFSGVPQGFKLAAGTPAPVAGDTWTLNFQDYAHTLSVAVTNIDQIAAADSTAGGPGDNSNMLALAALQTTGILDNGGTTFSGAYTQLVSNGAAYAAEADLNSKAFATLTAQAEDAQQSLSGVNLDEEAVNLIRYQQAYQAAAKAISVANTLFDEILAIGR